MRVVYSPGAASSSSSAEVAVVGTVVGPLLRL